MMQHVQSVCMYDKYLITHTLTDCIDQVPKRYKLLQNKDNCHEDHIVPIKQRRNNQYNWETKF